MSGSRTININRKKLIECIETFSHLSLSKETSEKISHILEQQSELNDEKFKDLIKSLYFHLDTQIKQINVQTAQFNINLKQFHEEEKRYDIENSRLAENIRQFKEKNKVLEIEDSELNQEKARLVAEDKRLHTRAKELDAIQEHIQQGKKCYPNYVKMHQKLFNEFQQYLDVLKKESKELKSIPVSQSTVAEGKIEIKDGDNDKPQHEPRKLNEDKSDSKLSKHTSTSRHALTKNRVYVFSADIDGFIFNKEYHDFLNMITEEKLKNDPNTIREALEFSNNHLINYIVDQVISGGFTKFILILGSNRQSFNLDLDNGFCITNKHIGSCYKPLEIFYDIIVKRLKERGYSGVCVHDKYLLADTFGNKKEGESFSKAIAEYEHKNFTALSREDVLKSYKRHLEHPDIPDDSSKFLLTYAQIQKIKLAHPNDEVVCELGDDSNEEILNPLHQAYQENCDFIPRDVTMKFLTNKRGTIPPTPYKKEINGSGCIDKDYVNTMYDIQDLCQATDNPSVYDNNPRKITFTSGAVVENDGITLNSLRQYSKQPTSPITPTPPDEKEKQPTATMDFSTLRAKKAERNVNDFNVMCDRYKQSWQNKSVDSVRTAQASDLATSLTENKCAVARENLPLATALIQKTNTLLYQPDNKKEHDEYAGLIKQMNTQRMRKIAVGAMLFLGGTIVVGLSIALAVSTYGASSYLSLLMLKWGFSMLLKAAIAAYTVAAVGATVGATSALYGGLFCLEGKRQLNSITAAELVLHSAKHRQPVTQK